MTASLLNSSIEPNPGDSYPAQASPLRSRSSFAAASCATPSGPPKKYTASGFSGRLRSASNRVEPATRSRIGMPISRASQTSGMPSATLRSLLMRELRNASSERHAIRKLTFGVERKHGERLATAARMRASAPARSTASIGSPSRQCTSRLKSGANGAVSMRIVAPQDDPHGLRDDPEVEAERPVSQIVEIEIDAAPHLVERIGVAAEAVHLREARDAGPHLVPLHVALDQPAVHLVMRHRVRPRADDAHAALEDVHELRQLVERGAAHEGTERGHARIVRGALHDR